MGLSFFRPWFWFESKLYFLPYGFKWFASTLSCWKCQWEQRRYFSDANWDKMTKLSFRTRNEVLRFGYANDMDRSILNTENPFDNFICVLFVVFLVLFHLRSEYKLNIIKNERKNGMKNAVSLRTHIAQPPKCRLFWSSYIGLLVAVVVLCGRKQETCECVCVIGCVQMRDQIAMRTSETVEMKPCAESTEQIWFHHWERCLVHIWRDAWGNNAIFVYRKRDATY